MLSFQSNAYPKPLTTAAPLPLLPTPPHLHAPKTRACEPSHDAATIPTRPPILVPIIMAPIPPRTPTLIPIPIPTIIVPAPSPTAALLTTLIIAHIPTRLAIHHPLAHHRNRGSIRDSRSPVRNTRTSKPAIRPTNPRIPNPKPISTPINSTTPHPPPNLQSPRPSPRIPHRHLPAVVIPNHLIHAPRSLHHLQCFRRREPGVAGRAGVGWGD